ncbi:fimbrial protein [uncultured Prevotella sp.]|uniref:fimbrial protein n=1 Tax=uncultured Prevotella sp. TaxID=159272 RepID=UPI0025CD7A3A|nr:fimbrial protein [uncultured Prevotella sp.]
MKRLADILLSVAALLLLAACTDDADVYNNPTASEGNLCVYVPVTRDASGVTGALGSSNPTYNASVDECKINDLHLYAFPVGDNGTFLSQELPSPEASNMLNENVASYQLKIKPGTYRVYVVANMKDVLDGMSINTEGDLKNVVLSYQPMSKPGMPVANNIPMIYEPATKAADGTTTDGTITISSTDNTAKTVVANLRFTCVKVCLNLVYDPDAPEVNAALKSNGLQITDVIGKRLSPQTNLLWDGKFTNPNVSDDYAQGIESSLYNATEHTGEGAYYSSWTDEPANANVNDKDIITVKGEGVAAPVDNKQKWLFRATYYLPERYVAQASQQSVLKVGGAVGGSGIKNSYNINLGHRQDETSITEVPTFPRSTYYEIVGRLKSLGNVNLDCIVGVKEWQMATIDADFNHTTLWVSSTRAEVTSLQDTVIYYDTNAEAGNITFGCDTKVEATGAGELPVVIVSEHDPVTKRIIFKINPAISVADFKNANALTGTAKVWIQAGNIKKYLDVSYDVTPYFKVDPVDVVIFYDGGNAPELTKVVKFTTNLGGIQFPSGWTVSGEGQNVEYAQSTINVKCDNTNVAEGTFTITAVTNPVTTTTHVFTVKAIGDNNVEQQIRVMVRPPVGDYIIYMRAINDLAWCNGGGVTEYQHSNMLDEQDYIKGSEENNNWRDGWYEEQNSKWNEDLSPHNGYHYVYIYTQIGETKPDGTKDENTAEWYFGGETDYKDFNRNTVSQGTDNDKYKGKWWPGRSMKADNNNPGWYYYSIAHNAMSVGNNGKGQAQTTAEKKIKPGQTLLIFSNGTFLDAGFQSHRFTHHNDPGITLFNYEDREGWYLYDPLSDPYYRVYDEKPTVVDVEYTIYTKNRKITAWYSLFGVNSGDGKGKFTMWCNNSNVPGEFECTEYGQDRNGKTWYKTILHLKAPLGEYDKILTVKVGGDDLQTTLFNGDNYPSTKMHGKRYVVEGSFDSDTKTWSQGAPFKK